MAGDSKRETPQILNKKARRNFEIIEEIEAGIALVGSEVKSLRDGRGEIADAHVVQKGGELFLINLRIEPYRNAGAFNHEETRSRKLLLHRQEIQKLTAKLKEKQLAIIPIRIYFNQRGKVKVQLGVGRGKKLHDRRDDERRQQAGKEIAQALKARERG